MYSNLENVKILVSLLKAYNIRHIVLSPGNRNVPLVCAVENDPFFKCYLIVDERSAGFVAVGLIEELKQPVAICCTSGTAMCNYTSSVAEAYYQHLPLVVLTANRNPYYLNQAEDQTIPQAELLKSITKYATQLPVVKDDKDYWYCWNQVNTALLEINHHGKGPVHIDFAVEKGLEKYDEIEKGDMPKLSPIKRHCLEDSMKSWSEKVNELKSAKKILVLYGQNAPVGEAQKKRIEEFAGKYNCVIATEHISNMHCRGSVDTCLVSSTLTREQYSTVMPDLVISFEGNFVSNMKNILKANSGQYKHWLVSESGNVEDPFRCLSDIFECSADYFFRFFAKNAGDIVSDRNYFNIWNDLVSRRSTENIQFSDLYAVRSLMNGIPENSILHIANSSSIRIANIFPLKDSVTVYCNRGTNGIDGSMSSFIGHSMVTDRTCFLLIGDLSFFYDMNGLWNNYVGKNVRILLNNNSGAELFHYAYGDSIGYISSEHSSTAKGWVTSRGFRYLSASNRKEFDENMKIFLSEDSDAPIFFEVYTSKQENAKALHDFYDANKDISMKVLAKRAIKNIIKK